MRNRIRAAVAAAILVASGLVAGAGAASAEPVTRTLDYTCSFPLIGAQPVSVRFTAEVPAAPGVGQPPGPMPFDAVIALSPEVVELFRQVGTQAIRGAATVGTAVRTTDVTLPMRVPTTIASTPMPPPSSGLDLAATGTHPSVIAVTPRAEFLVGAVDLELVPQRPGEAVVVEPMRVRCELEPGQDPVLFVLGPAVPEPVIVAQNFALTGSTSVRGATVGLSGRVDGRLDARTGAYTADVRLDPATVPVRLFGLLPAQADVTFTPTGPTTGALVDGVLSTESTVTVRFPRITLFGHPLAASPSCGTSVAVAPRSAPGFDPVAGGVLTGVYSIPPVTGCGPLSTAVSDAIAGPGNTVEVRLRAGLAPTRGTRSP
ncbi:DUF6801 domain-containing protein [Actinokineospora iranica]|uniref:DUF6801 domain-containing protein n=1 Tax=Actinokineospora iranica TaxID=1271860 RepID=A0A1G6ZC71_9PSEU|nr:DUF6801 domain-containing protein [Actinokineospora iranica]SDD99475.1 hypothetical protein SAMN05216174_12724 [Actinokineospora iranica]